MKKTAVSLAIMLAISFVCVQVFAEKCDFHQWPRRHCKQDKIVLTGIQFDTGSSRIKPASFPILDANLAALQANSKGIIITGFTDDKGNDAANKNLSLSRAEAVKKYYVQKGISADKIACVGMGEASPIASNATPEGRAENRRIEVDFK